MAEPTETDVEQWETLRETLRGLTLGLWACSQGVHGVELALASQLEKSQVWVRDVLAKQRMKISFAGHCLMISYKAGASQATQRAIYPGLGTTSPG
jgi:hypothetical protein